MRRIACLALLGLLAACGGGGSDKTAEKAACSQAASDAASANNLFSTDAGAEGVSTAARDFSQGAAQVRNDVASLDSSDPIRGDGLGLANALDALAQQAVTDLASDALIHDCKPLVPDIH